MSNSKKIKKTAGEKGVVVRASEPDSDNSLFSYDELFAHTKVGVYRNTPGPKGRFTQANLSIWKMFEADSKEEFLKHSVSDLYQNPSDRAAVSEKILKNGFMESEELHLRTLKSKDIICAVTAVLKKDSRGNDYFDGLIEDVTEQIDAKNKLRDSEARYKRLVGAEPECVKIVSKDNILLDMNPAGLALIEADSLEQVAGKSVLDIIDPDYREVFAGITSRVFMGESVMGQFKIIGLKGGRRWLETHAVPLRDENGKINSLLSVTRDITGQKKNEEMLRGRIDELEKLKANLASLLEEFGVKEKEVELEKSKYEALLVSISDGVIAIDLSEKIIYANDEASRLLGVARDGLIGNSYFDMWDASAYDSDTLMPPAERPITMVLKTGKRVSNMKLCYIRKDGRKFPVSMSTSQFVINGKIIGANIIFRDITVESEIDRAKTDFISIASHQLRTPLSSMKWLAEILMESKNLTAPESLKLNELYFSIERLNILVNDLLSISRMESGELIAKYEPFDVALLLKQAVDNFQYVAEKSGKKIVLILPENVGNINGNQELISEAVNNVLSNAIIYGKSDSTVTVKMELSGPDYVISINNFDHVISKEDGDRVFTKFFRAASAKLIRPEGSGLGLYISKIGIEKNGGRIWFESNEKSGTTFYFTVPVNAAGN